MGPEEVLFTCPGASNKNQSIGTTQLAMTFTHARTVATTLVGEVLEEIRSQAYQNPTVTTTALGPEAGETLVSRADDADDLNGWEENGLRARSGGADSAFTSWKRTILVEWVLTSNYSTVSAAETGVKRATMSVGMLVVSAGLLAARVHAGRATALADADRATRLAEAGIGAAIKKIETTSAWRSGATDPFESIPFGDDKVKVRLTDPIDSNMTDDATEMVEIRSEATVGGARRVVRVRVTPVIQPDAAMSYAILAQGAISFTGTSLLWAELPIHSNTSVSTTSSTVEATVTAVGTVTGSGYTPAGTGGAAAITMPVLASVIAEYEAIGSSGILAGSGAQTWSKVLISPANAPGTLSTNASGVYVMDCGGKRLTIADCRINGTLVLKNASAGVRLTYSFMWDPVIPGYPALIVDGPLTITIDGSDLSEPTKNFNYNPIGAAYKGSADSDETDVYACEIRGLVYASGNVTMSGAVSLTGPLIVGGKLTTNGVTAVLRGVVPSSGPPGFCKTSTLLVDRSTWTRVVDK